MHFNRTCNPPDFAPHYTPSPVSSQIEPPLRSRSASKIRHLPRPPSTSPSIIYYALQPPLKMVRPPCLSVRKLTLPDCALQLRIAAHVPAAQHLHLHLRPLRLPLLHGRPQGRVRTPFPVACIPLTLAADRSASSGSWRASVNGSAPTSAYVASSWPCPCSPDGEREECLDSF
jgi:hypothetical protein